MQKQGSHKKSELQMGIKSMNLRTLVKHSNTEQQGLIWRERSQYWVMIHGLYHTVT